MLSVPAGYKAICKVPCGAASVLAGAEASTVRLCQEVRAHPHLTLSESQNPLPGSTPVRPKHGSALALPPVPPVPLLWPKAAGLRQGPWLKETGGRCLLRHLQVCSSPLSFWKRSVSGIATKLLLLGTQWDRSCLPETEAAEEQGLARKSHSVPWCEGLAIEVVVGP